MKNAALKTRTLSFALILLLLGSVFLFSRATADTPDPADITFSPFGIGADYHTGQNLLPWIPQVAAIGIPTIRTCTPDQMQYLTDHNIRFGGLLYGVPPDDKLDAPGTLPVKDLASWSAFVTKSVKEANGKVKYWEVWNEPPNGIGPNQTAADYAKIMIATYDAAHAVDPTCKVGLAAKSVHVNWLEQTIKAGAKDHFDFIVLHPYEVLGGVADNLGSDPIYLHIVPTVRTMLAAQDPAKENVPVVFTELGSDASKGEDNQGNALVKAYTMGIAQGVACIEWFEGIDGDSGPMGLMKGDGTKRQSYSAMAQMIQHLGLHPAYLGWLLLNDKDYAFVFQGAKGTVLITWAPKGAADNIDFGQPVAITDPLTGNTTNASTTALTISPIIVDNVPDKLVTQAGANKTQPFPWGGDYSNAKSVSITFGTQTVEKGLHTQAAANVAADVVDYGGAARAGSIPGGNLFMIDPNFLCYTQTPIEVSIVVRRNAANDNAGFKFVYESTTGYKDLGWYTVPDNKEWHTVKYKIDDSEFVNMWNYSFALNSDGNTYNKYDIQSVTVTKLDQ